MNKILNVFKLLDETKLKKNGKYEICNKKKFHVMSIDVNIEIKNSKRTLKKYEEDWKNVMKIRTDEIKKIIC